MAPITTGTIPKAMWPGIREFWGRFYDEQPKEWPDLFDEDTSSQNYEEDVQVTGFGLASVKTQGGSIAYDSEEQGYVSRYTHVTYGLGYIVTEEEADDNLYAKVAKSRTQALAFSMRQTHEIVAANVYNRAFNSSYTGGDGKELCATDHPNVSGTWSNELAVAADLSEGSLEELIVQVMQCKNPKGLQIALKPEKLIVPPALWFEATRILKSALQNDTANNAVNALKLTGAIPGGVVINHYLSDSDAWFIRTNCPRGLVHYTRKPVAFAQDADFDTSNIKYKASERYSCGFTDPRGLFGSPGA